MADISKCDGKDCPLKETCYRYTAPDSGWQSYLEPTKRGKDCEHYWPVNETKEIPITDRRKRRNTKT